eukprot:TRINITY_DN10280_c0_g1_i1.p1 TRINITY_DN10280_c0_g1~~TRINITY_DN10280_c0_g1_i1.p1  ORF type:complete len:128 (+),score=21.61 TRINITY_DN10280_c0_g1_i1:35-418(+)
MMMDQRREEQTFQTEPREDERFYPSQVRAVIESVLNDNLNAKTDYDPVQSGKLCNDLSTRVREAVKSRLNIPRHKLSVQVVLGELRGQSLRISSKCLWDDKNDNFASYTFTNERIFCTALVFGCYFE